MTKPYYGITGVRSEDEARRLLAIIDRLGMPQTRQLMLGILVSYRGLAEGVVADAVQYLLPHDIPSTLIDDRRIVTILHFNSRATGLVRQVESLLDASPLIDGIQLNIAWPDPVELRRLRRRSYSRVILQIGARAIAEVGQSPQAIVERLRAYEGVIDDVLFDPSGGTGTAFDVERARGFLEAARTACVPYRCGVAGGLSGETVEYQLTSLVAAYPEISFDAQGRLRDPRTGRLDIEGRCTAYLTAIRTIIDS